MPGANKFNTGHGHRPAKCRYAPDLCFGDANFRPRRRVPSRWSEARQSHAVSGRGPDRGVTEQSARRTRNGGREGALKKAGRLLGGVADAIGLDNISGQGFGFHARMVELEVKALLFLVAGGTMLVGLAACALVDAATRALRRAKAGAYRTDTASRKALRIVHERSRHRPPTPEMLLEHWNRSRTSLEGKILLGSLMGDLAVSVDASYVRGNDGEIIGRHGGIRTWLSLNAPELSAHYKTLMHYKVMADKFRLACGLHEPDGAEEALGAEVPEHAETAAPHPARHPKAAEFLEKHRTMSALNDALCESLGLIRRRRRAS